MFEPPKDWRQDLAEIATAEIFGIFGIVGIFGILGMFWKILEFLECLENFGFLQFFIKKAP